jgi:catechol 2,3-dioxygenase-like lactoylglutathione lyase family enzyme
MLWTMAITQFLHVSICISDPARSVPFYRDVLGFEVADIQHYKGPGPSTVMDVGDAELTVWLLRSGGTRLELIHFARPESAALLERPRTNSLGLSHLTVGVDDPDRTIAELKARGVPVREHTRATFVDGVPGYQFLFEDPDGFLIEAYTTWPEGKFPY